MAKERAGTGELIQFKLETKKFDLALRKFVKKYQGSVEYSIKRVGFELIRRTTIRTQPRVLTGRMINGWHISFHKPSDWAPPENEPRQRKPDPGIDKNVRVLFLQNNVFYAPYHEYGANLRGGKKITPHLMLTKSVAEMGGELTKYLLTDMEPMWNREINGITGFGLTENAKIAKATFMKQMFGKGKAPKRRRGIK